MGRESGKSRAHCNADFLTIITGRVTARLFPHKGNTMETLPTIQVVNKDAPNGFMIINESDFDASIHTKFGETAKAEPVDDGIAMTDAELRAFIGEATGTTPHHKTGRASLVAQYKALEAATDAPQVSA
jgi:hypothetical protein